VTLFPLETARFGRSLFVCALFMAFPIHAALNLEGLTGYWMVPTAWTLPEKSLDVAGNLHQNVPGNHWNEPRNVIIGVAPLPHMEVVGRFAFPDLSFNGKLGWSFWKDEPWTTGIAVGMQDIRGGARFFHSDYAVVTQKLWWLDGSLGWGTGPENLGLNKPRLDGLFWGASLELPLPENTGLDAALIHDDDGNSPHTGLRLGWSRDDWSTHVDLSRAWNEHRWDAGLQIAHGLEPARAWQAPDSQALVRLRFGPWVQTFLGTEVGNLDAQVALDAVAYVEPLPGIWAGSRLRSRVWNSENFEPGHAFASYRQEPQVWWQGGGIGAHFPVRQNYGAWLQGGFIDGSWGGGALELGTWPLLAGVRVGGLAGAWYSMDWHHERKVFTPWLDWDSPSRTWFAQLDAGRYWNGDQGSRLRAGMRFGRFATSAMLGRGNGENVLEAKLDMDLGGLTWRPASWLALEPTPRWGQGVRTRLASGEGDWNWLRPALVQDPPFFARGRDENWP